MNLPLQLESPTVQDREEATARCLAQNFRLEDDDFIYNAYGMRVARFLGVSLADGKKILRFENLPFETEWENAKVLQFFKRQEKDE